MKKLLVLVATVCMVFTVTANVFADCLGQLNLDYSVDGQLADHTATNDLQKYHTNPLYIGGNYYFGQVGIGAEYITGNVKNIDTDINSFLIKCGYSVVAGDTFKLAIIGGYDSYSLKSNSGDKQEVTGIGFGCDMTWFYEDYYWDCSLYVSPNGDYRVNGTNVSGETATLYKFNLRQTCLLTEYLGLSAGMRADGFRLNSDSSGNIFKVINGWTLGLTYRF